MAYSRLAANRSAALLCGTLALCIAAGASAKIDPDAISRHVAVLASDAYGGRVPGEPAEAMTVSYLVEQLRAMGLEPGGDPQADGSRAWTQDVPLMRSEMDGPVSIITHTATGDERWSQSEEIVIRAAQTGVTHVAVDKAPVVFVGYGVSAPERGWDDFKGVDLKGKIALFLVNDPDFERVPGEPGADFGGPAMTYYGRWTYKFEEAARRGATGALVIHEDEAASYGWKTPSNSDAGPMFDIVRSDPAASHVPVEGWLRRDRAVALFGAAGLDFEAQKRAARQADFRPVTLDGVSFSASFAVRRTPIVSKNVVARLKGSGHPGEHVIYTAHWDHLGIGKPDASGDAIYNGAVDNAAGTAQVLEVARAFAQGPRPDRSVLFLFVTAEEKGLLGSEYYAANPLYPLATAVANLNTDSPRPTGPARDFGTAGDGLTDLQDMLAETGRHFERTMAPDPAPQAGRFYRSDHFAFAKRGVPAISFKSGNDLKEGGMAAGERWNADFTAHRYHQPGDEYGADWRSDGIAADADLLFALGSDLVQSRVWPTWKAGSEFKAIRDATASQRASTPPLP